MTELEKKNMEYISQRDMLNNVVVYRELIFKEESPMDTLYVMEVYEGGKIVPLKINYSPKFEKLLSKVKKPDEDKDQRIKEMGIKISELNEKLKNYAKNTD